MRRTQTWRGRGAADHEGLIVYVASAGGLLLRKVFDTTPLRLIGYSVPIDLHNPEDATRPSS